MSIRIVKEFVDLAHCEWCGGVHVPQHPRHPGMCLECGNRYNLYSTRRSQRRTKGITPKTRELHIKLLHEYKALAEAGYKTPKTLGMEIYEAEVLRI